MLMKIINTMKKLLILVLSITFLVSCSNDDDPVPSEVNIRLSNISEYDFENIVVNTSTGYVNYENINSGEMSQYKSFEMAYSYAFVELKIEGETYTLQPIDYVGETPLENGHYTYQLNANDSNEQYSKLSLSLIED